MNKLLEVHDLKKYFKIKSEALGGRAVSLKAVDGVSLDVYGSEIVGIVGESGCGKSTLGKTLLRLWEKTAGQVYCRGQDIFSLNRKDLKAFRKSAQMIFQDPCSSLNPRKRMESIIVQPLKIHKAGTKREIAERVVELLEEVGLDPVYRRRYPHQFSGGQRQRIGIARAIALHPELVICDEAVSALDVSIQAQILNLLRELQEKYSLTYVFIAHDLSVVEFMSDRIMVMYLGRAVELASKKEIVSNHLHPYTKALFAASPKTDPRQASDRNIVLGDVPSPISPPEGCHFHPRCPFSMDVCRALYPALREAAAGHSVACHLYSSK